MAELETTKRARKSFSIRWLLYWIEPIFFSLKRTIFFLELFYAKKKSHEKKSHFGIFTCRYIYHIEHSFDDHHFNKIHSSGPDKWKTNKNSKKINLFFMCVTEIKWSCDSQICWWQKQQHHKKKKKKIVNSKQKFKHTANISESVLCELFWDRCTQVVDFFFEFIRSYSKRQMS